MDRNLKYNLEKIFRDSNSSEIIYDAFQLLLLYKIKDANLFKMLLANPSLSSDEITMFSEKLAKEFKECSYDIYFWTAKVLENKFGCHTIAANFYIKAINIKPFKYEAFNNLLNLYDYEVQSHLNNSIIEFILTALEFVEEKTYVYQALSGHYQKLGNLDLFNKYSRLAEKPDS